MFYVLTQSKTSIVPIDKQVYVCSVFGKDSYTIETDAFELGAYKNKERAYEVLKAMADRMALNCISYEMPNE